MTGCSLCDGACAGADLTPLCTASLAWLWKQLAATADRRGDPHLRSGSAQITVPADAELRAAATGLLADRPLSASAIRRVSLSELTRRLRVRGQHLSPGAVAAHAVGRRLAVKAQQRAERDAREARLADLATSLTVGPAAALTIEDLWPELRRARQVHRLVASTEGEQLIEQAHAVLIRLPPPGRRTDRRRLASDATGDPHALDDNTPLARLVLTVLAAAGATVPGRRPRAMWDGVGVDCDDLTGGLIMLGIHPQGWTVPPDAVLTLPPRELSRADWSSPREEAWLFVTENPSVATAAADLVASEGVSVALICTSGTPSALEIATVAALATVGWQVAVRADFDEAGLAHVRALLNGVPGAVPWRMDASDYRLSRLESNTTIPLDLTRLIDSPWSPALATAMHEAGTAGYEEGLLEHLLDDLRLGRPCATRPGRTQQP